MASTLLYKLGPSALLPQRTWALRHTPTVPPAQLPSLTPPAASALTSASNGPPATLSLLPPGCFESRLALAYESSIIQVLLPSRDAPAPTQRALSPLWPSIDRGVDQERMARPEVVSTSRFRHENAGRESARACAALLPRPPPSRAVPAESSGEKRNGSALAASKVWDHRGDPPVRNASPTPAAQTQATYRRGAPYNIIINFP
ncbi:hypothetical protein GH5_04331 [Leishmania sp. Ghana 2012 LV757]|uniref:hypothetical protein n=1 Tax=Leishmania sp. Ghana 2012 LV757 TaxID=2803181 RepID=UPI001B3CF858|nr:hypothetical protein GH5_04331 [Leishmania sp. Ghana 2012 LV757]